MGVVAINFVEFGSLLFEVTKNFRLFQKNNEEIFEGLIEPKLKGKAKRRSTEAQI